MSRDRHPTCPDKPPIGQFLSEAYALDRHLDGDERLVRAVLEEAKRLGLTPDMRAA